MTSNIKSRVPITVDNYIMWKVRVQSKLVSKGYPDSAFIKNPTIADELKAKGITIKGALAYIFNSLDDIQLKKVYHCTTPFDVYAKLDEEYDSKNSARMISLTKSLFTLSMSDTDDIRAHVRQFEEILDQLASLNLTFTDPAKIVFFYITLPSSWQSFISASQVSTNTKDSFEKLKEAAILDGVTRQELRSSASDGGGERAFMAKPSNSPTLCSHCKRQGHTIERCWVVHPEIRPTRVSSDRNKGKQTRESGIHKAFMTLSTSPNDDPKAWHIDSGATSHVSYSKDIFSSYEPLSGTLEQLDGRQLDIVGRGIVSFRFKHDRKFHTVKLSVLHVPGAEHNLFSVQQATTRGMKVEFFKGKCIIKTGVGKQAIPTSLVGGLHQLDAHPIVFSANSVRERALLALPLKTWHERLGHVDVRRILRLAKESKIDISNLPGGNENFVCVGCIKGKAQSKPVHTAPLPRNTIAFNKIHSDICGPMRSKSTGGAFYYATFIDDSSDYTWLYFLKNKSDLAGAFVDWITFVETQYGAKVKILHSDRGGEYIGASMQQALKKRGVLHEMSAPHTPQHNGIAERKNRSINNMARSMMQECNASPQLWAEACTLAIYILNSIPDSHNCPSPAQILLHQDPDFSRIRKFGCHAYAIIKDENLGKFESKVKFCYYMGPAINSTGYRLFDPATKRIINSRNVAFDETNSETSVENVESTLLFPYDNLDSEEDEQIPTVNGPEVSITNTVTTPIAHPPYVVPEIDLELGNPPSDDESESDGEILQDNRPQQPKGNEREDQNASSSSRISITNTGQTSSSFASGDASSSSLSNNRNRANSLPPPRQPSSRQKTTLPIKVREQLETQHALLAGISTTQPRIPDPATLQQALSSPYSQQWQKAMEEEMAALSRNSTWELVPRPPNTTPIGVKWVFKTKYDSNGEIGRFKARLVAKGYKQRHGIDFYETYAPVARMVSIRVIIAIAVHEGLQLEQIDVDSAFLNGLIDAEVYLSQPPNFVHSSFRSYVCKLLKGLYGLKQAGKIWHDAVRVVILQIGLIPTEADPCVFVAIWKEGKIIIALHVDDFLIAATMAALQRFKDGMAAHFSIKLLGKANLVLGIQLQSLPDGIFISQSNYVQQFLADLNLSNISPRAIPVSGGEVNATIQPSESSPPANSTLYKHIIGKAMYAMVATRPDIAFSTSFLGRFMANPSEANLASAKGLLRYLQHTSNFGIRFQKGSGPLLLKTYADSDWAGSHDRKSTGGYISLLGNSPISWESKRQSVVALSSTEAEYIELTQATKQVIWERRLLKNLGHPQSAPTTIFEDNQSAMSLAEKPGDHRRTKHIDVQYHFIREKIESKEVQVEYCPTGQQLADIMTKALPREKFVPLREQIVSSL